MQVENLVNASVIGRDDEGLALDDESNMTDKTLIQNRVHGFAIIFAAIGEALHSRARCRCKWLAHARRLGRTMGTNKSQSGWAEPKCISIAVKSFASDQANCDVH